MDRISYKLAIALKDAGYPQHEGSIMSAEEVTPQTAYKRLNHRTFDLSLVGYPRTESDYYEQGKFRPSCIFCREFLDSEEGRRDTFYFPSLSELIVACGESFLAVAQELNDEAVAPGKWYAMVQCTNPQYGDTPEEAVANLWLALNKPNHVAQ